MLVPFETFTHQFPPPPVIETETGSPGRTFGRYESGVPVDAESWMTVVMIGGPVHGAASIALPSVPPFDELPLLPSLEASMPEEPDVPLVPEVPEVPDVPLAPEVPDVPDVPLEAPPSPLLVPSDPDWVPSGSNTP